MHIKKFSLFINIACLFLLSQTLFARQSPIDHNFLATPDLNAKSYILIDYNSNQILAQKDINHKIEPASLTKMMTMYVIDKELQNNSIKLTDLVPISSNARHVEGSRMFLELGSKIPVADLIKGIIIQSGNDASVAMAEYIAGSEQAFANIMNSYAKNLSMHNSHFANTTGLPNPEHYSTAEDLAKLSKALIKEFPESYKLYSEKTFTYNGIKQNNRNRLLWSNSKVDGIKTGHTDSAGFCLAASGVSNNMRLIAIIVGASNDENRTMDANKLLTWGDRFFETHKIFSAGEEIKTVNIWKGDKKKLTLGIEDNFYVTVRKGQYDKLSLSLEIPDEITAPIQIGQHLGNYNIKLANTVIAQKPLVALNQIKTGNTYTKLKDSLSLGVRKLMKKFTF